MYDASSYIPQLFSRMAYRLRRSARPLGQAVLELVWPTRCACCERLGVLLCPACADALLRINHALACPRCGAPHGKLVCTECTPTYEPVTFTFERAVCALEFTEPVRRLIVAYKDGGERRLAPLLAQLTAQAIPLEWRRWADALTWVPADAEAVRRRGFDHLALIARSLGEQTGLDTAGLLVKQAREDQRALSRRQRQLNAGSTFALSETGSQLIASTTRALNPTQREEPHALRKRNVLLIDDVLTTGATLDAAARVLCQAGIEAVRVATIARVW